MQNSMKPSPRRNGESGVSLVELLVVCSIFAVMGMMTYNLLVGTAQTNLFMESNNDLSEFGQRMLNEIKTEVLQSKQLLDNTAHGAGYLAALDMSTAPPMIDSTKLPTIELNGSFSPGQLNDPDLPFDASSVGNAFLFVEAVPPFVDTVNNARVDLYRFIFYYVGNDFSEMIARRDHILQIYRWQSAQFADYNQLVRLLNYDDGGATLENVLSALQTADAQTERPAIDVAWDSSSEADSAFYDFSGGSSLPNNPDGSYSIEMDSVDPAMMQLAGPRIGGKMPYSIAFNSGDQFDIGDPVPLFATADTSGDGFPNGFESMIVGPPDGRQVFLRLVLAADNGGGRLTSRENIVLISARDY